MKIIVHSLVGDGAIEGQLGADDYSYYFVRRFYSAALQNFAEVVAVSDPAAEVDPIYDRACADGVACVFLSFAPPHKTVLGLRCPVVPVFAWEFSTIPNEVWSDDIRNDWRAVFAVSDGAIALSSYTARIVKTAMGQGFPIAAIPAPVFELFQQDSKQAVPHRAELRIAGTVLDTNREAVFRAAPIWPPEPPVPLLTPGPLPPLILPAAIAPNAVIVALPEPEAVEERLAVPEGLLAQDPVAIALSISEPEPQGVVVTAVVEPETGMVLAALPLEPERIGLRRRLQITKHFGLEWYRLAVRDLLPRPVRAGNALAGRTVYRTYRALRPRHAVPMPPPVADMAVSSPPTESVMLEPVPLEAGIVLPEPVATVDPEPEVMLEAEPTPEPEPAPQPVAATVAPASLLPPLPFTLDGVVFVSMFSPRDGRKNWNDIVTAFCWAMRDVPDATLVLKIVATDHDYEPGLRRILGELSPMRCRVVVLHGFLETADYRALIEQASFYVNASHCEGLCLPMLEFMSAGTPAIAPAHTAFEDYVTPENALVIGSGIENTVWPGDGRDLFRTTRYRIDWYALMLHYREAYRIARQDPERYAAMSRSARETMAGYCGIEPVTEALRTFLQNRATTQWERAA